ncbi:MAG: hypothetical protein EOP35_22545, partial [Rubrivivax sp.]
MDHRWLARGLVVALHAAALLALWLHRPPRLVEPGERRFTTVRLIEPQRRAPPPATQPRPVAPAINVPRLSLPPPALEKAARPDDEPSAVVAPPATTPPATLEAPRTTLRLT